MAGLIQDELPSEIRQKNLFAFFCECVIIVIFWAKI